MAVVLVQVGGLARSGHSYADADGRAYEYPKGRYERWVQRGEAFVYQTPKVGYVGVGRIGEIADSPTVGRLICKLHHVLYFQDAVPLKEPGGAYYEADGTYWKSNVYWVQGIRPLADARWFRIARMGGLGDRDIKSLRSTVEKGRNGG